MVAGGSSKFKVYDGPPVTRVIVSKSQRKLFLMHGEKVLRWFRVGLGFVPEGDKLHAGDGRTPEGRYWIDRRNPNSNFHLSLGISYPNARDIAEARALGKEPGGDIFIHGRAGRNRGKGRDWTYGCIAVNDRSMEAIYAMVETGTEIYILP
ncbi:L,D-transpeptidase family protein [Rhodovulum iodosum]